MHSLLQITSALLDALVPSVRVTRVARITTLAVPRPSLSATGEFAQVNGTPRAFGLARKKHEGGDNARGR